MLVASVAECDISSKNENAVYVICASVQRGNHMALPVNFQVSTRIGRNKWEANTMALEIEKRCFKSRVRRNEVKVHFQKYHVPRFGNYFSTMTLVTCRTRISFLFVLSATSEVSRKIIPKLEIR